MSKGIIFDIKEFAINDGPGLRLTVFFKGCQMNCIWCHNPEGLSFIPEKNNISGNITGREWDAKELAQYINKYKDVFISSKGGVTFSGGEPLAQSEFILEILYFLKDIHIILDTSGYCNNEIFKEIITKCNIVYYDLKIIDNEIHKKYTGIGNEKVIENLNILAFSNTAYHIRIPLIQKITDTEDNLNKLADIIISLRNSPKKVDLLPYNKLAGGKYPAYNKIYSFGYENEELNDNNIKNFIKRIEKETNIPVELMK